MSLQEAMLVEEDYLKLSRNKGAKDRFYLHERMELAGYPSLEVYHREKQEFLWSQFKPSIRETTVARHQILAKASGEKGEEVCFIVKTDKRWLFLGKGQTHDADLCANHSITPWNLGYNGECTILTSPEDLNLVIVTKLHGALPLLQKKMSQMLRNIGVENTVDGYDILMDGTKICGCAEVDFGSYVVYYYQINFATDTNLFNAICKNDKAKRPKGIREKYKNLSREALISEVTKWLL